MADKMSKIAGWFSMRMGRRFWYAVELQYYPKNRDGEADGMRLIKHLATIGFARKSVVLNKRKTKKIFGYWAEEQGKRLKWNGIFVVKIICYLGWLKEELTE